MLNVLVLSLFNTLLAPVLNSQSWQGFMLLTFWMPDPVEIDYNWILSRESGKTRQTRVRVWTQWTPWCSQGTVYGASMAPVHRDILLALPCDICMPLLMFSWPRKITDNERVNNELWLAACYSNKDPPPPSPLLPQRDPSLKKTLNIINYY